MNMENRAKNRTFEELNTYLLSVAIAFRVGGSIVALMYYRLQVVYDNSYHFSVSRLTGT